MMKQVLTTVVSNFMNMYFWVNPWKIFQTKDKFTTS